MDKVLAHLLDTLPLSADDGVEPRMGVAQRAQELKEVMASEDVGIVGLHGMGGIGKTTLAKTFFNMQCVLPGFSRRVLLHVGKEAEGDILLER